MLFLIFLVITAMVHLLPLGTMGHAFPRMNADTRRKVVIGLAQIFSFTAFVAFTVEEFWEGLDHKHKTVDTLIVEVGMGDINTTICSFMGCCPDKNGWWGFVFKDIHRGGMPGVVIVRSLYSLQSWFLVALQFMDRKNRGVQIEISLWLAIMPSYLISSFSLFETYSVTFCGMVFKFYVHLIMGFITECASILSTYLDMHNLPEYEDNRTLEEGLVRQHGYTQIPETDQSQVGQHNLPEYDDDRQQEEGLVRQHGYTQIPETDLSQAGQHNLPEYDDNRQQEEGLVRQHGYTQIPETDQSQVGQMRTKLNELLVENENLKVQSAQKEEKMRSELNELLTKNKKLKDEIAQKEKEVSELILRFIFEEDSDAHLDSGYDADQESDGHHGSESFCSDGDPDFDLSDADHHGFYS